MIEEIHNYYTAEKAGVPYVVLAGILLVGAGILILFKASAHPISKGIATGFLISGGLLIVIILSNKYYNDMMIKELPNRIDETELELQQSEIGRMEKVMNFFSLCFLGVCLFHHNIGMVDGSYTELFLERIFYRTLVFSVADINSRYLQFKKKR
ncbi:hypothetical protein [Marinoscillum sp. 108]|uniref:hypothetical protein n=1 Tax=Marinoscillum sp. 108 TaxID=2653151 RepID=UPI0012F210EF|nr:hypothetical protein [Marinoscillum sp. 108]VXD14584.1 membrane hypothetical protein [Marinoscillum sp. 108]